MLRNFTLLITLHNTSNFDLSFCSLHVFIAIGSTQVVDLLPLRLYPSLIYLTPYLETRGEHLLYPNSSMPLYRPAQYVQYAQK